jgi:UDP-2-acetamido-2,6-beta-L-arabino-hexul-4-ose reductase
MRIVVTGGRGFIGRNLRLHLQELGYHDVSSVGREANPAALHAALAGADFVFHLAGVNRPPDVSEFDSGNRGFTATVCAALRATGRSIPIVYASSTQASLENPYGISKRAAELEVERYGVATGASVYVLRLPNVFGKWCRPNYNSVVATFCHNIARGLPITISDPAAPLHLVHIDDVVAAMIRAVDDRGAPGAGPIAVAPVYHITLGELAASLHAFAASRETCITPPVGTGFVRALYGTYVSYITPECFTYPLVRHADPRGVFAEVLKTPDCGQFSFFTAHPGVTRGGHYHHTKTEKFLVVKGRARFGFRHVIFGDVLEIIVSDEESRVVETVPGWAHDITNIGDDEMVVMLWANEIFDPQRPDTIAARVLD